MKKDRETISCEKSTKPDVNCLLIYCFLPSKVCKIINVFNKTNGKQKHIKNKQKSVICLLFDHVTRKTSHIFGGSKKRELIVPVKKVEKARGSKI